MCCLAMARVVLFLHARGPEHVILSRSEGCVLLAHADARACDYRDPDACAWHRRQRRHLHAGARRAPQASRQPLMERILPFSAKRSASAGVPWATALPPSSASSNLPSPIRKIPKSSPTSSQARTTSLPPWSLVASIV